MIKGFTFLGQMGRYGDVFEPSDNSRDAGSGTQLYELLQQIKLERDDSSCYAVTTGIQYNDCFEACCGQDDDADFGQLP